MRPIRLGTVPRAIDVPQWFVNFTRVLDLQWKKMAREVEKLQTGVIAGTINADSAAPTTGDWSVGDFIRNNAPAEAGTAGSKYVILGWVCSAAGSPGTWLEVRTLTGN